MKRIIALLLMIVFATHYSLAQRNITSAERPLKELKQGALRKMYKQGDANAAYEMGCREIEKLIKMEALGMKAPYRITAAKEYLEAARKAGHKDAYTLMYDAELLSYNERTQYENTKKMEARKEQERIMENTLKNGGVEDLIELAYMGICKRGPFVKRLETLAKAGDTVAMYLMGTEILQNDNDYVIGLNYKDTRREPKQLGWIYKAMVAGLPEARL